MSEIKEIMEPKRFPSFEEACKELTREEIYTLAEATYRLQVEEMGGVIDE